MSVDLPLLADLAALGAAAFAWRVSPPIAVAIGLAVAASALHAWTGAEALRWSSALVGLVGVVELGRARPSIRVRAWAYRTWARLAFRTARFARADALAVLCVASMAGDGAAMLLHQRGLPWVFDLAQIVVSGAAIAVCTWPRRRVIA
jgi:hypothetical protein